MCYGILHVLLQNCPITDFANLSTCLDIFLNLP